MTQATYDPNAPSVRSFVAYIDGLLNLSERGLFFNWPWPVGSDSTKVIRLKAQWRKLRHVQDEPYKNGV
jgi:hypothetical protein